MTDPRFHNYDYVRICSDFYTWTSKICRLNGKNKFSFELSNFGLSNYFQ